MRDISPLLADWPFDPEQMKVRLIAGDDGRQLVQLRLDLGVLQMEMDGRPDGATPAGAPSWLDYYERLQAEHSTQNIAVEPPFDLDNEACQRLLREGVQYYHRYLSFWHLDLYELCARDTARNLRLFAFVRQYAADNHDKLQFDQWRPYVTMMHTRAVSLPLVKAGQLDEALEAIDRGIEAIEDFLREYRQLDRADTVSELVFLRRWRRDVASRQQEDADPAEPSAEEDESPLALLERALAAAVADERYEEAARLRDEIRRTRQLPPSPELGKM